MRLDVCTLVEPHYHPGLAALLNSLVAAGFEGTAFVAHRGPAPAWARGRERVELGPRADVVLLPVRSARHLSNVKPLLLLALLERTEAVAYLDPDIAVLHPWADPAAWVQDGIVLCADVHPWFPASHPTRKAWLRLAAELGDDLAPAPLELYVNAGFVAVRRGHEAFLRDWERYVVAMAERGPGLGHGPGAPEPAYRGRTSPWMTPDQDALNLAAMAHAGEVSLLGPQAMGLAPGWPLMRHAIGSPKTWQRSLVRAALRGTKADRAFLRHAADGPLPAVTGRRERAALGLARALAHLRA